MKKETAMQNTKEIYSIIGQTKAVAALLSTYYSGKQTEILLPETLWEICSQIEQNLEGLEALMDNIWNSPDVSRDM